MVEQNTDELESQSAEQTSQVNGNANQESDVQPNTTSSTETREDEDASIAKPSTPLCGVCNINPPKYKCPRCYLRYCSLACNKVHRENHPPDAELPQQPVKAPVPEKTNPTPPEDLSNPFRALDSSDSLRHLFQKYPDLPNQLLQIHAATQPPTDNAGGKSAIPASLMKGLPQKETWNHDMGIQSGKQALRRARKAGGEEGAAIKEYTELILHIMENGDSQHDATGILQQQIASEDAKLIERLMANEKS